MSTDIYFPIQPVAPADLSERHPYGPSPLGFNTGVGLEVGAAAVTTTPLTATVRGQIRLVPAQSGQPASLLLAPFGEAFDHLAGVMGGAVYFVYRNLDVGELIREIEYLFVLYRDEIAGQGSTPPTIEQLRQAFAAGEFPVSVDAGTALGRVATSADPAFDRVFGFEVIHVANGVVDKEGYARYVEMTESAYSRSLRFDPLTFYSRVASGAVPDVALEASQVGHAFLTVITPRVLIDLRDEHNEPFVGQVDVLKGAIPNAVTLAPADRGTIAFSDADDYTVGVDHRVLTDLPTGPSADAGPSRTLSKPDHWLLQSIFMDDVDDPANWFTDPSASLPRFTAGNRVTPLIDGRVAFPEMVKSMQTVRSSGNYFHATGWWMAHDLPLVDRPVSDPNSSFKILTEDMAQGGAQVKVLLWRGGFPGHRGHNQRSVDHLNTLTDPAGSRKGFAFIDDELPQFGSHHQKTMIVNGDGGAHAYCGGMDLNENRLDDEDHQSKGPYHDVHAKVEGPAVADIHTNFVERWNNHPAVGMAQAPPLPATPPPFEPSAGSQYVQVSRTFAPKFGYSYLPGGGELGNLSAVRRAIQKARHFIYFEDQYASPFPNDAADGSGDTVGILQDLLAALDRVELLVIVVTNHLATPLIRAFRGYFFRALLAKAPDKVRLFYLKRKKGPKATVDADEEGQARFAMMAGHIDPPLQAQGNSGGRLYPHEIYLHSKVWVIDDVFARIGSCNCNRRGFTHDSELDLNVIDGATLGGSRRFAKEFRIDMWAHHLQLKGAQKNLLDDPIYALRRFWKANTTQGLLRPYTHRVRGSVDPQNRAHWNSFIDPEGRP